MNIFKEILSEFIETVLPYNLISNHNKNML